MFSRKKQQIIIYILATSMAAGFFVFRYLPMRKKRLTVTKDRDLQRLILVNAATDNKKLEALNEQLELLQGKELNSRNLKLSYSHLSDSVR